MSRLLPLAGSLILLLAPLPAMAQGQDSVTAPMAPQTNPHPASLSQATVTSVPGGKAVPGFGMPVLRPKPPTGPLDLPGSVALAAPDRLACGDIGERSARTRCEGLRAMPAPPRGPSDAPPPSVTPQGAKP